MPGANLDPAVLAETIELEEVTFATGVPTVMQGLIDHYRATRTRPATLKRVIIGGARCPERIIEEFEDVLGVEVVHGWGMTELSPVGTMNMPRRTPAWQSPEERNSLKVRQGRPPLGVDLRLVGDDGQPVPHDGETSGHLCVKGWAAVARYYGEDDTALDAHGYFDTGDIATIDLEGFMAITDRAKDLVKSGGEWISSQEIERHALSHPAVAMAAVIGVPHQKWGERPRLIIQRSAGRDVTADEIRAHLEGKIAAWWMPDEIAFRDEMPLNATGKIDKKALRAELSYTPAVSHVKTADFKRGAQTPQRLPSPPANKKVAKRSRGSVPMSHVATLGLEPAAIPAGPTAIAPPFTRAYTRYAMGLLLGDLHRQLPRSAGGQHPGRADQERPGSGRLAAGPDERPGVRRVLHRPRHSHRPPGRAQPSADHHRRLGGGLVGFTALCGAAQNFTQLVACRIGVGVGEAGCTPPAHSLIADYVPRRSAPRRSPSTPWARRWAAWWAWSWAGWWPTPTAGAPPSWWPACRASCSRSWCSPRWRNRAA